MDYTVDMDIASLLLKGFFQFKTLSEAMALSNFFGSLCPNPSMATVGISEILINAIEHGNLSISHDEKNQLQTDGIWEAEIERRLELPEFKHKFVTIDFLRTDTDMTLKVTDQGKGFDPKPFETIQHVAELDYHGRGIVMAKHLLFKKLEYSKHGTEVTCVIALDPLLP